jgi:hypothetical protein
VLPERVQEQANDDRLSRAQIGRLHSSLAETNPAHGIDKFKERRRKRFLTSEELERLDTAICEAETTGIPWTVDASKPTGKPIPKAKRFTRVTSRLQQRRCGCFFSPAAGFGKSCTCVASTSTPRGASEAIATRIAAALDGKTQSSVITASRSRLRRLNLPSSTAFVSSSALTSTSLVHEKKA